MARVRAADAASVTRVMSFMVGKDCEKWKCVGERVNGHVEAAR